MRMFRSKFYLFLRIFKVIVFILLGVVVVSLEPPLAGSINVGLLREYLIILFLALVLHFGSIEDENFFRIDVLFLLGFIIVHFQWVSMLVFSNIKPEIFERSYLNSQYITYGTWLSLFGVLSWFLGFSFASRGKESTFKQYKVKYNLVYWVSFFALVLFVILAGKKYLTGDIYSTKNSSPNPIEGIGGYAMYFYMILFYILTVLVVQKASLSKRKNHSYFSFFKRNIGYTFLLITGVLVFLIAGDRSSMMFFISAFFIIYSALVKKISGYKFFLMVLLGAFIFTLIGILRTRSGINMLNDSRINSFYYLTLNLSDSVRTLYFGLSYIDKGNPYFYGKLWLGNILGIIPFAQSSYLKLSGDAEYFMNTASFITFLRYGLHPTSGTGTSFVVDIFLNFGKIGVVFVMFFYGFIVRRLHFVLLLKKNMLGLLIAVFFGVSIFYVGRGNVLNSLKTIVWGLLISKFFVTTLVIQKVK